MGRIGPRQQRYEVLPAESYDLSDLLRTWRAQAAPYGTDRLPAQEPTRRDSRAASHADD